MTSVNLDDKLFEVLEDISCEQYCKVEEYIKINGAHIFSEEFNNNMKFIIPKEKNITNMQPVEYADTRKRRLKIRYLLVAILVLIMSVTSVFAIEPLRETLKEIIYTIFPDKVSIDGRQDIENTDIEELEWKKPMYVPENYTLVMEDYDEELKESFLLWENNEGETIVFMQSDSDHSGLTITADGQVPVDIKIDDLNVKLIVDEIGTKTMFYEMNGYVYTLTGNLEIEELIKFIENLE